MTCDDVLDRLGSLEPGATVPRDLETHLEACAGCRRERSRMARLDALAREGVEALKPPALDPEALERRLSPRRFRWVAAAAALLLAATGLLLWQSRKESPVPPGPSLAQGPTLAEGSLPRASRLEVGPESLLELASDTRARILSTTPLRIALDAGRLWVEAEEAEILVPAPVRVSAGSRVALEVPEPSHSAGLLLREASAEDAGEPPLVWVLAGEARVGDLTVPAGFKARLSSESVVEPLTEADRAAIDGWRAERICRAAGKPMAAQGGVTLKAPGALPLPVSDGHLALSAELRQVRGHVVLRYPVPGGMAEATLGALPALKDGSWHRLDVSAGRRGAELFLDGRRILRTPPEIVAPQTSGPTLGVRGERMEVRDIRLARDGP